MFLALCCSTASQVQLCSLFNTLMSDWRRQTQDRHVDSCRLRATLKYSSLLLSLTLSVLSLSLLVCVSVCLCSCACVCAFSDFACDGSEPSPWKWPSSCYLSLSFSLSVSLYICVCVRACAHPLTVPVMGPEPSQWKWQVEDIFFFRPFFFFSMLLWIFDLYAEAPIKGQALTNGKNLNGAVSHFPVFLWMIRNVNITAWACGT